jgi:hypothetical protein
MYVKWGEVYPSVHVCIELYAVLPSQYTCNILEVVFSNISTVPIPHGEGV